MPLEKNPTETVIAVALPCEARPFIDAFRLKKCQNVTAYALYQNLEKSLTLIVSGTGLINAAAGTVFAAAYLSTEKPIVFLNVGIAGGFDVEIGDLFLVNKVSDETGRSIYPMVLGRFKQKMLPLVTLNQARQAHLGELVDMEGFAFYQVASRFSTLERIQALKIVSDNQTEDRHCIDPRKVQRLIESQMESIESFLDVLIYSSSDIEDLETHQKVEENFEQVAQRYHLTQYRRHQVKALVYKLIAFGLESKLQGLTKESNSIKDWLRGAEKEVEEIALDI